jgi:two-component system sensor histidine kinase TctE
MRSAYTLMEPVQKNRQTPVLIEVAETLEKRGLLANEIIKGVVLPQFMILPVALALVWFADTWFIAADRIAETHPRTPSG